MDFIFVTAPGIWECKGKNVRFSDDVIVPWQVNSSIFIEHV